jgi:uncharacterized protein (TIGR00725 family)
MTIGVVGSARLEPPDPRCALAAQAGAAVAARGWTLLTGGYGGLMAVSSRAAAEAGGRVVGLPMRGWAGLTPNQWNHELRWSDTYSERLAHLLAADAVIVLDGGIGTLSEAATVWAALQTEPEAADLVFVGQGWGPVLAAMTAHLVIDDRDLAHVTVCAGAGEAVAHIARARSRQRGPGRPRG